MDKMKMYLGISIAVIVVLLIMGALHMRSMAKNECDTFAIIGAAGPNNGVATTAKQNGADIATGNLHIGYSPNVNVPVLWYETLDQNGTNATFRLKLENGKHVKYSDVEIHAILPGYGHPQLFFAFAAPMTGKLTLERRDMSPDKPNKYRPAHEIDISGALSITYSGPETVGA